MVTLDSDPLYPPPAGVRAVDADGHAGSAPGGQRDGSRVHVCHAQASAHDHVGDGQGAHPDVPQLARLAAARGPLVRPEDERHRLPGDRPHLSSERGGRRLPRRRQGNARCRSSPRGRTRQSSPRRANRESDSRSALPVSPQDLTKVVASVSDTAPSTPPAWSSPSAAANGLPLKSSAGVVFPAGFALMSGRACRRLRSAVSLPQPFINIAQRRCCANRGRSLTGAVNQSEHF